MREAGEGRGSAPNPARGLCPLDAPPEAAASENSMTGSVGERKGRRCGEAKVAPSGVPDGAPSPRPEPAPFPSA